jgi:hypothetical protein
MKRARVLVWGYNANVSSLTGKTTSSQRILQHAQTLVAQLQADRAVSALLSEKATRTQILNSPKQHALLHVLTSRSLKRQTTDLSSFFVIHWVGS